jgi:alpha-amylase/alpha-mannosidase (GH57 family)
MAASGCVEFLDQTYYHSIASLYPEKEEFIAQVKMHSQIIKDLLGYTPTTFENTELLYNNTIAKTVEDMGYKGIYTEGVEKILGEKSPNFIYTPKGTKNLRVLLRNYKLTDDVGFRFSARWWPEWPLTAPKYANWIATTKGEVINIFPDYETFGEHHWPETGIHSFLQQLEADLPNDVRESVSVAFREMLLNGIEGAAASTPIRPSALPACAPGGCCSTGSAIRDRASVSRTCHTPRSGMGRTDLHTSACARKWASDRAGSAWC